MRRARRIERRIRILSVERINPPDLRLFVGYGIALGVVTFLQNYNFLIVTFSNPQTTLPMEIKVFSPAHDLKPNSTTFYMFFQSWSNQCLFWDRLVPQLCLPFGWVPCINIKSRLLKFCNVLATRTAYSKGILVATTNSTNETNEAGCKCH